MGQVLERTQTQSMSPLAVQTIQVLQLDAQELNTYINECALENPILDVEEGNYFQECFDIKRQSFEDGGYEGFRSSETREKTLFEKELWLENLADPVSGILDLTGNIMEQLPDISEEKRKAVCFLAEHLNQAGYLDIELETAERISHCSKKILEDALKTIQSLEPAGIGARSLAECLELQLLRCKGDIKLALEIVREYLPEAARGQYSQIAGALHVSREKIRKACEIIRSLEPKPGCGLMPACSPEYIVPDAAVIRDPYTGKLTVNINEEVVPKIQLNKEYVELLHRTDDPQLKEYLSKHQEKALQVITAVERRNTMLRNCVEFIVKNQTDFFARQGGSLHSLSVSQAAAQLGVHPTTVWRALNEKYLKCEKGIFPFRYFFQRSVAGTKEREGLTPETIKAMLTEFILTENKKHPFSDQAIADFFAEKGYPVARRTIAKYRTEMNIPSASGRRR